MKLFLGKRKRLVKDSKMFYSKTFVLELLLCVSFSPSTWSITQDMNNQNKQYLYDMSIEDLMNIKVTSVSKKEQKLSDAAAAISVITQEDIRRSGVTSIPEALRMVPGLQVARIDANKYAISSRGFNGRWANKLLVLMDGRSIYSHMFSGVIWETQDTLLEDIDRIEVIRGPGAALWGANAVNGVINIITKSAKETQGTLMYGGSGTEESSFSGFRYGGEVGNDIYYRFYTKYFDRDNAVFSSGEEANDQWDALRAGFRIDAESSQDNTFSLMGDLFDGEVNDTIRIPSLQPPYKHEKQENNNLQGGNVIARMTRKGADNSYISLQVYYDHFDFATSIMKTSFGDFDIDFQHQFELGTKHHILWGLGYRHTYDHADNTQTAALIPDSENANLFSTFLQDDMTLINDDLYFILGSKLEHNDYTGYEFQPSARIMWKPNDMLSIWSAISRSVRTPSRGERDNRFEQSVVSPDDPGNPSPFPILVKSIGNRNLKSEELIAYEMGFRFHAAENLTADIAAFINDYDRLLTAKLGSFDLKADPPHIEIQAQIDNVDVKKEGYTHGIEVAFDWKPFENWRLQTAYTYLYINLKESDINADSEDIENENPKNQFSLRSMTNIGENLELDLWLRYVDSLPNQNVSSYTTLDARLGYQPKKNMDISIVAQNLFNDSHPEFKSFIVETLPSEVERSIYGKISLRF